MILLPANEDCFIKAGAERRHLDPGSRLSARGRRVVCSSARTARFWVSTEMAPDPHVGRLDDLCREVAV